MRLIIVRHGETDWTLIGRCTGATDVHLTANGRHEAATMSTLLQRVLRDQRAVVVSSPLRRATETAALALPGYRVKIDPLVTRRLPSRYLLASLDVAVCLTVDATSIRSQPGISAGGTFGRGQRAAVDGFGDAPATMALPLLHHCCGPAESNEGVGAGDQAAVEHV
jgi:hypothetical protein